jgi:signal transduction histidine kinase
VHLESRVVRIDDNEVVVTSRDISDRAEVEGRQMIREQRELSRLSHEIHEGLAQLLTGAHLSLECLRRGLESESPAHSAALKEVGDMIRQAVRQAQNLSQNVSRVPPGTGLFDALYLAVHHAKQHYAARCEFVGCGPDDGVSQVATAHLYQIAQEAIRNAVRHGGARKIRLACAVDSDSLTLSIEDDGDGLPEAIDESYGIGIRMMRYRARAIGGTLAIEDSRTGQGAVVRCVCPLVSVSDEGWRFPEP